MRNLSLQPDIKCVGRVEEGIQELIHMIQGYSKEELGIQINEYKSVSNTSGTRAHAVDMKLIN